VVAFKWLEASVSIAEIKDNKIVTGFIYGFLYSACILLLLIQGCSGGSSNGDSTDVDKVSIPQNLVATAVSASRIDLTWDMVADITGYRIYRDGNELTTTTQTTFSDTGLIASTEYSYTVSAYDASGSESGHSNVSLDTTLAVTEGPVKYTLTINAVNGTVTKDPDLNEYEQGSSVMIIAIPNEGYIFNAWGSDGVGGDNPITIIMDADKTITAVFNVISIPPQAPGNLNATAISSSQINLSWQDNSDNEEGFRIERSKNIDFSGATSINVGANTTSYNDIGLESETTYYYRITADNSSGRSTGSNLAQAKTHMYIDQPKQYPVGWWTFDERKWRSSLGFGVEDLSGNNNFAAFKNRQDLSLDTDNKRRYFTLDGIDDYVDCGKSDDFEIGRGDLTISAWIKLDPAQNNAADDGLHGIVAKGGEDDIPGYMFCYNTEDKSLVFWMKGSGETGHRRYSSGNLGSNDMVGDARGIEDNEWHFVAVTIDRDRDAVLYVDENEVYRCDIIEAADDDITNEDISLYIGNRLNPSDNLFKGGIDDVSIYKAALSKNNIDEIRNPALLSDFLIGRWKFDETTGDRIHDVSLYRNDGTLCTLNADGTITSWVSDRIDGSAEWVDAWEVNASDNNILHSNYISLRNSTDFVNCGSGGEDYDFEMGVDDLTICSWIKMDQDQNDAGNGLHGIVTKGGAEDIPGYMLCYNSMDKSLVFRMKGDGETDHRCYSTGNLNDNQIIEGGQGIEDNNWHFIGITIKRAGEAVFYVDENEISQHDISVAENDNITNLDRDLYIGQWLNDTSYSFNGDIDDVRLYKKALTVDELCEVVDITRIERVIYVDADNIHADGSNSGLDRNNPLPSIYSAFGSFGGSLQPGDTIVISPRTSGTYDEQNMIVNRCFNNTVTIIGAQEVVLDGQVDLEGQTVLDGQIVLRDQEGISGAIYIERSSNIIISGLKVRNYKAYGIYAVGSFDVKVVDNQVFNNGSNNLAEVVNNDESVSVVGKEGHGIDFRYSYNMIADSNIVYENCPSQLIQDTYGRLGTGINTYGLRNSKIINNIIYDNRGGGILVEYGIDVRVNDNDVYGHRYEVFKDPKTPADGKWHCGGIWVDSGTKIYINGNIFSDNIAGIFLTNLHLWGGEPDPNDPQKTINVFTITNNELTDNNYGIEIELVAWKENEFNVWAWVNVLDEDYIKGENGESVEVDNVFPHMSNDNDVFWFTGD